MGWRDLLQKEDERLVAPWLGGRSLRTFDRTWRLQGRLPREHGWYEFQLKAREATLIGPSEAPHGVLRDFVRGYLVGDRLVPDGVQVPLLTKRGLLQDAAQLVKVSEPVSLVEDGLDRFVRVAAGRFFSEGPLIYDSQEFPLGPEDEVLAAYQDDKPTVDAITGVAPALNTAFLFESWRRAEAERIRREEQERREREERERLEAERREQIRQQYGTAQGRRALAEFDFEAAARAALEEGGAHYLEHRRAYNRNEMVVRFRLNARRFECTCDARTLRIIDAGICLTDHDTGVKGDQRFTLESLPSVIQEAERNGVLVVWRHV